jgi:hypothetical protein
MAPFTALSLLTGLKDRIEAILLQGLIRNLNSPLDPEVCRLGEILYLGTSTGTLNAYAITPGRLCLSETCRIHQLTIHLDGESFTTQQLESKPNFTRRPIEQLGYIRDVNSLVTLSGSSLQ